MSLQALGRRVDLRDDMAGGVFFGMCSSLGTIVAQPDIMYTVFDKHSLRSGERLEFALVGIREDALVSLPAGRTAAVYASDVRDMRCGEIEALLAERPLSFVPPPPYIGLIERRTGSLIGLECRSGPPGTYLRLASSDLGVSVQLRPPLLT